jgi:4-amino-4-deoxy-L-arabinose transferase-like glycosyltransferase
MNSPRLLASTAPAGWRRSSRGLRLATSTRVLLALGVGLHALLACLVGLSPDEAHYALYGARLDWSYYDHPPLAGWLQAFFVGAGGADALMRIVPMAAWLATACLTIAACRILPLSSAPAEASTALPGDRAGRDNWAVGLLLISPLLNLLGVALVPDSLLMPLVPLAMLATWRLRDPHTALRTRRWVPLGVAIALAILAKYTGVFIVLAALAMLVRFHRRHVLSFAGFRWTCVAAALACAPIIAWNLAHHWASIAYQAGHVAGSPHWRGLNVLRALALQLLVIGPLLPIAAALGARNARVPGRGAGHGAVRDARVLVLAFALPVGLVFLGIAAGGSSLPHWTACGWTALIPLAVAGVHRLRTAWRRGLVAWQLGTLGLLLGVVVTGGVGTEAGAAATSLAGEQTPGRRPNPAADLFGWDQAAARATLLARARGVPSISVMNWSLASRIAWYARPATVHVVQDRGDQFTLWFGALAPGESTVLVDWSQMSLALPVGRDGFSRCTLMEQQAVVRAGRQISHFDFYLCEGWRSGSAAGTGGPGGAPALAAVPSMELAATR